MAHHTHGQGSSDQECWHYTFASCKAGPPPVLPEIDNIRFHACKRHRTPRLGIRHIFIFAAFLLWLQPPVLFLYTHRTAFTLHRLTGGARVRHKLVRDSQGTDSDKTSLLNKARYEATVLSWDHRNMSSEVAHFVVRCNKEDDCPGILFCSSLYLFWRSWKISKLIHSQQPYRACWLTVLQCKISLTEHKGAWCNEALHYMYTHSEPHTKS